MNKDIKTLIILTPGFPQDESDTACLPFLQSLVIELKIQYPLLKVIILAFDYPFIKTGYEWNQTRVFSFNRWKKSRMIKFYIRLLIHGKIKKLSRENNVLGLLSLWCGECALMGSRAAKKNNLPHICWIQGQDAKKGNKYVPMMKPSPGELIAISDFIQKEFQSNYGIRPAQVIPLGIRPAEFIGEYPTRDIDILGVGSLIPLKQYDIFIEIIAELRKFSKDIKVVLCGKGPEESHLKMLIAQYDLKENITLRGELPHGEILKIMMRSRVFLHTSVYEGLAAVFPEALYAGCKVVSFVSPMDYGIENWHIFRKKEGMIRKILDILMDPGMQYTSVLPFTAQESIHQIMRLFNYRN